MKKPVIVLIILIICVGIGFAIVRAWSGLTKSMAVQLVATRATTVQLDLTPTIQVQMLVATVPPTAISGLGADQMVQNLNAQAVTGVRPGWVRIQENIDFDTDSKNRGVLPNGMTIPNRQINDTWYHLNDERLAIEGVDIMRTTDGQIVQVGVSSNSTSWNSATNEVTTSEPIIVNGFDYGFLKKDLQWLEGFGDTAVVTQVVLPGGADGIQIVIGDKYDQPVRTNDYIEPSTRAETRAVFDSATGYLVSREVTVWFEDGSWRVLSSLTQKITFEAPTGEVLNFLSEKNKR
jgi:hypothetical protein